MLKKKTVYGRYIESKTTKEYPKIRFLKKKEQYTYKQKLTLKMP